MPLVSIIIPTRNRAGLLERAIESALLAGNDVEVIVVDDCSTDNTAAVCAELPGIIYERLERQQGPGAARNAGILKSSAKFVAFLDDDDLRLPNSLDSQLAALEKEPSAAFCYGRVLLGDTSRQVPTGEFYPAKCLTGDVFWQLMESNFVPLQSVVITKDILMTIDLFNPSIRTMQDWDLWLRLAEHHPVTAVEEAVAIYRKPAPGSGQMSSNAVALNHQKLDVQARALRRPRALAAPASKRRRLRRRLVNLSYQGLIYEAATDISTGDLEAGRAKLREAIRVRPLRSRFDPRLLRLRLA